MAVTKTLMTAEELWQLPEDGKYYELVKGELVEMTPPGGEHGYIASRLAGRLGAYVEDEALGYVLVETGYCLECSPDTVRGPDLSFVRPERLPEGELPKGFIPGAPDLAVEIISTYDRRAEIQQKIHDYLSHGTHRVWVIDPDAQTVTVYRPDGSGRLLGSDDFLDGEDVIPGFTMLVSELWG